MVRLSPGCWVVPHEVVSVTVEQMLRSERKRSHVVIDTTSGSFTESVHDTDEEARNRADGVARFLTEGAEE